LASLLAVVVVVVAAAQEQLAASSSPTAPLACVERPLRYHLFPI